MLTNKMVEIRKGSTRYVVTRYLKNARGENRHKWLTNESFVIYASYGRCFSNKSPFNFNFTSNGKERRGGGGSGKRYFIDESKKLKRNRKIDARYRRIKCIDICDYIGT